MSMDNALYGNKYEDVSKDETLEDKVKIIKKVSKIQ